jgi:hypothetical protein
MFMMQQWEGLSRKAHGSVAVMSRKNYPSRLMILNPQTWHNEIFIMMPLGERAHGMTCKKPCTKFLSNITGLGNEAVTLENGALWPSSRGG